jgi:hypothetical protein
MSFNYLIQLRKEINGRYRFRRDLSVVEVEVVRLPASQEFRAQNLADDGAGMGDAAELDVAFRQEFEEAPMEDGRRSRKRFHWSLGGMRRDN